MTAIDWLDTPQRYGLISRSFHWLMAALFAWQFAGALLYVGIGDTALTRFVGGSHFTNGFVLFVLVLLRGSWGLLNFGRRPTRMSRAAAVGHAFIYALMIVVPSLSLLRWYGSGDEFAPLGVRVMAARGTKIEWMAVPADLFHYWLGFVLFAVILGHVAMTLVHRLAWKDDVLSRMT